MLYNLFFFVAGLILLYYGARWLVNGSASLAASLGVTPLVIGLTVVAFGTSAPELFISVVSSIKGKSMIAIGNVVGSNICNITLVLGIAAVLMPIQCNPKVIRRDIPVMIAVSLYVLLISFNGTIGRIEGVSLFSGIVVYTIANYYIAARQKIIPHNEVVMEIIEPSRPAAFWNTRPGQILLIVLGITGVITGADFLVDAAVVIMKTFGVSEKFIGLTIVALGTSLPELATSVVAALKKEMDISIGNLVGSNVFNLLSVLGATAMVRPITIPGGFFGSGLFIDYLVMLFTSSLPLLMARKTHTLNRGSGILLLVSYTGYIVWLVIKS